MSTSLSGKIPEKHILLNMRRTLQIVSDGLTKAIVIAPNDEVDVFNFKSPRRRDY